MPTDLRNFRQSLWTHRIAGGCAVALLAAAFSLSPAFGPTPAQAAAGAPPFCVKQGGSMGPDSRPQICRFYDYQTCLQAAADLNGNCVVNIDYRGVVSTAPVASRERRVR